MRTNINKTTTYRPIQQQGAKIPIKELYEQSVECL